MIIKIEACFSCDKCGRKFIVRIDPAYSPPANWSMFDVAVDAIRGGYGYVDDSGDGRIGKFGTVADDLHRCDQCSNEDIK